MSGKTYRMGWHGARVHNIGDVGGVGKSRLGDTGDGQVGQDFHFDAINEGGGKTSGIRANCSRRSSNSAISNIAMLRCGDFTTAEGANGGRAAVYHHDSGEDDEDSEANSQELHECRHVLIFSFLLS